MKKILIITLYFISLNAADDKKTTFKIGNKIYKSYSFSKDECEMYSSFAIHRMNDAHESIDIIARYRDNEKTIAQCILNDHSESTYEIPNILSREHFDLRDGNIRSKILSLYKQYIVAHTKKMELENSPHSENEKAITFGTNKLGYLYDYTFSEDECTLYSSMKIYVWKDWCRSVGIEAQLRNHKEVKVKCWVRDYCHSTYELTGILKEEYFKLHKTNRRNKALSLCKEYIRAHIKAHAKSVHLTDNPDPENVKFEEKESSDSKGKETDSESEESWGSSEEETDSESEGSDTSCEICVLLPCHE